MSFREVKLRGINSRTIILLFPAVVRRKTVYFDIFQSMSHPQVAWQNFLVISPTNLKIELYWVPHESLSPLRWYAEFLPSKCTIELSTGIYYIFVLLARTIIFMCLWTVDHYKVTLNITSQPYDVRLSDRGSAQFSEFLTTLQANLISVLSGVPGFERRIIIVNIQ